MNKVAIQSRSAFTVAATRKHCGVHEGKGNAIDRTLTYEFHGRQGGGCCRCSNGDGICVVQFDIKGELVVLQVTLGFDLNNVVFGDDHFGGNPLLRCAISDEHGAIGINRKGQLFGGDVSVSRGFIRNREVNLRLHDEHGILGNRGGLVHRNRLSIGERARERVVHGNRGLCAERKGCHQTAEEGGSFHRSASPSGQITRKMRDITSINEVDPAKICPACGPIATNGTGLKV